MRKILGLAALALALGIVMESERQAAADPPPAPFFQGFETDTSGWFSDPGDGSITRQPSAYSNSGGYADGVASATGGFHARLGLGTNVGCLSGGGPQIWRSGPYTQWGGYSSQFPAAGYITRLDIYLDVAYAQANVDTRFDWASAINDNTGNHRRDFVFNVGTDPLGFVMTASTNSTRCGAFPANPGQAPVVHISTSDWYTFEHTFKDVGGVLVVEMRVIRKSTASLMGMWTRSVATDLISGIGGNRYGWVVNNEFLDLAIDNSERTGVVPSPPPECAGMTFDNVIVGSAGPDNLTGTNKSDFIFGGGGDDVIDGGNSNDCIDGGDGDDTITGGNGNDVLLGGAGEDEINGDNGGDRIFGGEGNDTLYGDNAKDGVSGNGGNDYIDGGNGSDTIDGGSGSDTCVAGIGDVLVGCEL